jgi:hypothetical protein
MGERRRRAGALHDVRDHLLEVGLRPGARVSLLPLVEPRERGLCTCATDVAHLRSALVRLERDLCRAATITRALYGAQQLYRFAALACTELFLCRRSYPSTERFLCTRSYPSRLWTCRPAAAPALSGSS